LRDEEAAWQLFSKTGHDCRVRASARSPDGSRLELVRGEIVVIPPPKGKHGICCSQGVLLVWLVDPETRTVTVYRGSMRGLELGEAEILDGGNILPGFSCKIANLFE
jgi:Uma2 family endonuclease